MENGKKQMMVVKEGNGLTVQEMKESARALFTSKYFNDLQSPEQAFAKIVAGSEMGLQPFYSLNHLFIVPGKPPAADGQCIAAMIRKAGYSFKEVELNDKKCTIDFFDKLGKKIGTSSAE